MERRVEIVDPSRTFELRHRVLRPGRPLHETIEGVMPLASVTFGLTEDDDPRILATATVYPEDPPSTCTPLLALAEGHRPWRLRAVATEERRRREGLGALVLDAVIDHITEDAPALLWCNARLGAAAFYTDAGFSSTGPVFTVEHLGDHVVMYRALERASSS